MARDWGNNVSKVRGKLSNGCSYRRTTLVVCSINIVVALYVLCCFYASVYVYSSRDSARNVKYTPDQIRVMEESVRMRKAAEPTELARLVKLLEKKLYSNETVELPPPLKRKITDQIFQKLKVLNASATIGEQREKQLKAGGRKSLEKSIY